LFVVAGVRKDGDREILGARIANGEDAMWQCSEFTVNCKLSFCK